MKFILNKKNTIIFLAAIFVFNFSFFSFAENYSFSDLDLLLLGKGNEAENTFVIGDGCQSFTEKRTVTQFYLNRFETTYDLWYSIRTAAESLGYTFLNPGQEGSFGKRGAPPTENNKFHPVTMISWYDAIIWCNAFSELSGFTPCYTFEGKVLKDATDTSKIDLCECNFDANGYRLPTETEWEFAARKTKSGFQSGALMSGQVDKDGKSDSSIPEEEVSWTSNNSTSTHLVGTAGTPWQENAPPKCGSGNPNASGLFDMSGNVLEYVWDWFSNYKPVLDNERATGVEFGSERVSRGGSYSLYTPFSYAADRYSFTAAECYDYTGFRIAKTK